MSDHVDALTTRRRHLEASLRRIYERLRSEESPEGQAQLAEHRKLVEGELAALDDEERARADAELRGAPARRELIAESELDATMSPAQARAQAAVRLSALLRNQTCTPEVRAVLSGALDFGRVPDGTSTSNELRIAASAQLDEWIETYGADIEPPVRELLVELAEHFFA